MSLSNGRSYLAIPGPSVMPDRVLQAMHRASPNIYRGELIELTHSLVPDLKSIARTDGDVAMYIGNGHAAWEASLANTLSRGDTVLVLATGRFCIGWGEMAEAMGITLQTIDFGFEGDIDMGQVAAALAADKDHAIKAVLCVQVDTSSSVKNDIKALRDTMTGAKHPALLMVDCMASLGCDVFEMDAWGVDLMVAGCQKGLMTPAGLAFVFFNAKAKAHRGDLVTSYWDWMPRIDVTQYYRYFDGTAPTHHLYGLRTALDIIHDEGIENVWTRHRVLAETIWAAFAAWETKGQMRLNISDPSKRGTSVTAVCTGPDDGAALQDWTETQAGLTLGIGLGRDKAEDFYRIGHMGHVNAHMIMGMLGTIQAGLNALNIEHGAGALDAAAQVIGSATRSGA